MQVKQPYYARLLTAFGQLLDWFLPPLCPATGQMVDAHGMIDPNYWASLNFISHPFCPQCAVPYEFEMHSQTHESPQALTCAACLENPPPFAAARSSLVYDDASSRLILRFKNADQLQSIRTLTAWTARAGADILAEAELLVPVPLHRFRLLKRRYNQSALLAKSLAKHIGKPSLTTALKRTRNTRAQASLKFTERKNNVKNAFIVPPQNIRHVQNKNIVLIDDVYTTGATLNACATALLEAGAARITVLTIARALKY